MQLHIKALQVLIILLVISTLSVQSIKATNTCTAITGTSSTFCAGDEIDISITPDATDTTKITFGINAPSIANSKYCLAVDYSTPSLLNSSDIHVDSTGKTTQTRSLTIGPHRVAFFISENETQFNDSFRCSKEIDFVVTSTTPPTPTPTPNAGDPECIVGVCCDLARKDEITNKCKPNSYCDFSNSSESCFAGGTIGTVRAGVPPIPTPTPTTPSLWNRLTGSLLAVDCPPKMTYISIFDACLDFATTMSWGMNWALIIASLLALIRFAVGAVKLITSTGDPSKLQDGRETLTDAILGLVLLATAWIIFGYLNSTFPEEWQIDLFSLFG